VNSKTLLVQKFGGTSLSSPERIRQVAARVAVERQAGKDVIVVVSAMGDTTDELFQLARTVSPSPPKRELDMLLTAGERISMALLSMAIADLGYEAISFTGSQSGIVTDTSHTRAKILDVRAYRVREELEKGRIVIVAGFQGVSSAKEVTTLGRGGSDTTCVALAAALSAQECDIYTDVAGVYTADPRLVAEARKIPTISYDEMLELSFCGAGVLHWRSVDVARRFGVRIHVRSSFRKEMGTIVTARDEIESAEIRGITQDMELARLSLNAVEDAAGSAGSILQALEAADLNVRFLAVSQTAQGKGNVTLMIQRDQIDAAGDCISGILPEEAIVIDKDLGSVSIVGHGLSSRPGIAKRILDSLSSLGIRPELVTTSGITMTIVIPGPRVPEAVRRLHADLGLEDSKRTEGRRPDAA
jgi:aspartate kinase